LAKERVGGAIGALAGRREREHLAPSISDKRAALEKPGFGKSGEQLRHSGSGNAGSTRQLCSRDVFACDRAQRQILGHRQSRVVRGE
jgi:hypothetical protein